MPTIDDTSTPPFKMRFFLYDESDKLSRNRSITYLRMIACVFALSPPDLFRTNAFSCLDV
jgi:hypothetical protein